MGSGEKWGGIKKGRPDLKQSEVVQTGRPIVIQDSSGKTIVRAQKVQGLCPMHAFYE
jgi:hypothetical protein